VHHEILEDIDPRAHFGHTVESLGLQRGGGGADVKQSTTTTTLGKELQDLDDAYKKGLLSEKEYTDARKNLMTKYND
jgi:hypothetical protein